MERLIITLDGPAGSGKSTVARMLAKALQLEFLDTGAMYRGITAACLDRGIDPATQPQAVAELARTSRLKFDWSADPPTLGIETDEGCRDLTGRLRDADVTVAVSDVAAMAAVRHVLVEAQRHIGMNHRRMVSEGRDQGSVVFPDAAIKFYLDASPQVRAQRRAEQLRQAGSPADALKVLEAIRHRDDRDFHRYNGPLRCTEDAIRIDTTQMKVEQVVKQLVEHVQQHAPFGRD